MIAVVDARTPAQLAEHAVVRRQIGFTDRVLVSKGDLWMSSMGVVLSARGWRGINLAAGQYRLAHGEGGICLLFDLRGFIWTIKVLAVPAGASGAVVSAGAGRQPAGVSRASASAVVFADDIAALHFRPRRAGHAAHQRLHELSWSSTAMTLLRHRWRVGDCGEPRRLIFRLVHKIAGFDYGREWGDEAPRLDIIKGLASLPEAAPARRFC